MDLSVTGSATRIGKYSWQHSPDCLVSDTREVEPVWVRIQSCSNALETALDFACKLGECYWGVTIACATFL